MTATFGKVGVLFGGRSAEREVSLMSGRGVCEALRSQGVDAYLFDTGLQSVSDLIAAKFDRVFIALHGRYGEDGTLQGLLETLGLPYTGSGVMASSMAMDKILTKKVWLQAGLRTPNYVEINTETQLSTVIQQVGLPLMIKPPLEGSTLGIVKVTKAADLLDAFREALRYDKVVLAEQFITGREVTVALLGSGDQTQALPPIQIVAPDGNYDYQNKYFTHDTQYLCPAPFESQVLEEITQLAVAAYRALGCEGWGRADFMLDEQNRPWLLEMNTSPGMTGHSLVPMAAKAVGMSYPELCVRVLSDASCKVGHAGQDAKPFNTLTT
jgi:D-alanine-D-alanine ligase